MKRIILTIGIAALAAACGSDESKLERGVDPGPEVAVPESDAELGMTEAERRAKEIAEEEGR